jgi:serpin B
MKRKLPIILSAIFALVIVQIISGGLFAKEADEVKENVKAVAESNNAFAFDLYGELAKGNGNLFFSPASVSTALAMIYAGARGNTASEMKEVLHFTLPDDKLHNAFGELAKSLSSKKKGVEIKIANALWGREEDVCREKFLKLIKDNYGASLNRVDFGNREKTRKAINAWGAEKTGGRIKELFSKGDFTVENITFVLTNAIYFKGRWAHQFKKKHTKKDEFHLTEKKSVKTEMMHIYGEEFPYMKGNGFSAIELSYTGGKLAMLILLPVKTDGLGELEKKITKENLEKWSEKLCQQEFQTVALPRFKLTSRFQLAGVLKSLGMKDAFSAKKADFSGITEAIWVGQIVHKTFVDVNEEGTEGAAATGAIEPAECETPEITFKADHPFVFIIRDRDSGAVLFMGRVTDPTQKEVQE